MSVPAIISGHHGKARAVAFAAKVTRLGQWTNHNGTYILCVLFVVFGLQNFLKALGH